MESPSPTPTLSRPANWWGFSGCNPPPQAARQPGPPSSMPCHAAVHPANAPCRFARPFLFQRAEPDAPRQLALEAPGTRHGATTISHPSAQPGRDQGKRACLRPSPPKHCPDDFLKGRFRARRRTVHTGRGYYLWAILAVNCFSRSLKSCPAQLTLHGTCRLRRRPASHCGLSYCTRPAATLHRRCQP